MEDEPLTSIDIWRCHTCGAENALSRTACSECGSEADNPPSPQQGGQLPRPLGITLLSLLLGLSGAGGLLTLAGSSRWCIDLEIRLHRLQNNRNRLLLRIWQFLETPEAQPLVS